ncbi:MAG: hypothetical protein EA378_03090 [Phycisphaerales bacterium]|nr:MAG: hypothetical protein EA378_03090 [Phycisphaerales bacterium]
MPQSPKPRRGKGVAKKKTATKPAKKVAKASTAKPGLESARTHSKTPSSGPPLPPLYNGLHELGNVLTTLESLSRSAADLRARHARASETAAIPVTLNELQELLKAPFPEAEPDPLPPKLLSVARNSIAQARGACTAVREAVRAGGGNVLDAMTRPGDRGRSVELLARIKACEALLTELDAGLSIPNAVLDGIAEEAAACRDWCRSTVLDLEGAMELVGTEPPRLEHEATSLPPARGSGKPGHDRAFRIHGYTASELREAAGNFSQETFRRIRTAAGISGDHPDKQHRRYTKAEVLLLAEAAESGLKPNGTPLNIRNGKQIAMDWRTILKAAPAS